MRLTENHKKIIEDNINLVKKFHKEKVDSGEISKNQSDDFLSFLLYRFCYSVKKFDEKSGFKLSTYAYGNFYKCLEEFKQKSRKNNIVFLEKHLEEKNSINYDLINSLIEHSKLSTEEKDILSSYFLERLSLNEIGKKYSFTTEKTRRRKNVALNKFKKELLIMGYEIEDFKK